MKVGKWLGRAALVVSVMLVAAMGGFVAQRDDTRAEAAESTPAGYIALSPGRVLDTRPDTRINYFGPKPVGGQVITVPGVAGASAVAVNITMTETEGGGYLSAWSGQGARPTVSIINSSGPGENIANFAVVPVAADGSFALFTFAGTHIVVDLMGWFPAGAPPVPAGLTATITGYGPLSTITEVSGIVSNGSAIERDVRVDVTCPNGTVQTDHVFDLQPGATAGWSVICDGAFTSGASILQVVEV